MTVLVTRPGQDGKELCQLLQQHNRLAIHHPLIEIRQGEGYQTLIDDLAWADIIIAVSQHAVHWAHESLTRQKQVLPIHAQYFAIGNKTAHQLQKIVTTTVISPLISDSEHLLDLPALKLAANQRILILRGNGGRELIHHTLQQRGALVRYNEIYQRDNLPFDGEKYYQKWQTQQVKQLVITSGAQLDLLCQQIPKNLQPWLKQLTLYIPSRRIEQQAEKLGFSHIINTGSAANSVLMDYLCGN